MKTLTATFQELQQSDMGDDRAKLLRSLAITRQEAARSAATRASWAKLMVPGAVAVAALIVSLWFFLPQLWDGGHAEQTVPVAVESQSAAPSKNRTPAIEPRQASASGLTASGYVVARRKATVAAEITGKVVELMVDEGVVVQAGQVVAQLDSILAETDLTLAQSKAAAAEAAATAVAADLRDAERIFSRVQSLSQKNISSEADLTKAEAKVGVLRAQLGQARANVQTARLDAQRSATVLDKHKIRAPFGGVVVERSAQPGEMISPISAGGGFTRTGICTIVDMDSIEIEVDVNEAFIGRVRPGGAIEAVLDAYPDWKIPAAVIAVVPTANREKATVKVRIALKQKDPRVLPDMAVKVKFFDDASSADGATSVK
jgi:HlyD family secretion protein